MEILETLYEKPPTLSRFQERKVQITSSNTLLLGPKSSGKTTLILDYLSRFDQKEYLYISAKDLRIKEELKSLDLSRFYRQNGLKLLVIDDYSKDIALPKDCNLILSSWDTSLHVKGLKRLTLDYLDFEEFIAFSKGSVLPEHIFNLYTHHGRLPGAVNLQDWAWFDFLQNQLHQSLSCPNQLYLLKQMAFFQSKPLSLHQLYKDLKNKIKLSKDTLYESANFFQRHGFIHFLPKWQAPKTPKKLFLRDFALKNAITFEKDFLKSFENIIFCELTRSFDEIFYTDKLDFYIPSENLGIICIPFLPPELILRRFSKILDHLKSLQIKNLTILTLGNEGAGKKDEIECEIIPFWEWALRQ